MKECCLKEHEVYRLYKKNIKAEVAEELDAKLIIRDRKESKKQIIV